MVHDHAAGAPTGATAHVGLHRRARRGTARGNDRLRRARPRRPALRGARRRRDGESTSSRATASPDLLPHRPWEGLPWRVGPMTGDPPTRCPGLTPRWRGRQPGESRSAALPYSLRDGVRERSADASPDEVMKPPRACALSMPQGTTGANSKRDFSGHSSQAARGQATPHLREPRPAGGGRLRELRHHRPDLATGGCRFRSLYRVEKSGLCWR